MIFNWHIIKAPHSVVDYVVIHELCHLIHPNHSKDFWQLVARHDASHPEHRQWLREQGEGILWRKFYSANPVVAQRGRLR